MSSCLSSSPVWVIACMRVEQAGGTEKLQMFHSDEDYNEEYMRTLCIVNVQNQIFAKMQHQTDTLGGEAFFPITRSWHLCRANCILFQKGQVIKIYFQMKDFFTPYRRIIWRWIRPDLLTWTNLFQSLRLISLDDVPRTHIPELALLNSEWVINCTQGDCMQKWAHSDSDLLAPRW